MKKILIYWLSVVMFFTGSLYAQTIPDGIKFLYEDRDQSAKAVFDKLLAVNPNNIEATYWLGQAYIAMNDVPAARQLYEKALAASANAPLVIVGMGHVELLENKTADARQRFETAITMTHTKKGDDPDILNAIGRANVDAKAGDLAYAIEKLEAAVQRNSKNPDIFLNLGNAYRKARPGENGGQAYLNYKKALDIDPNFAIAYYRIAKLFETQQNWELFVENLNQAVAKDQGFGPAYYDLYYYYLLKVDPATGKIDFDKADDYAKKYIANTDPDVQNEYLRAQTLWAQKNYSEAINVAQGIISKAGDKTLPRTYKLLAYSYIGKGDTVQAKTYIDQYFAKQDKDQIVPPDYLLKADIYSGIPGVNPNDVVKTFFDAVNADTLLQNKIELLKKGAALFKAKKLYEQEAQMEQMIVNIKPNPTLFDMFNAGLSYYLAGMYDTSRNVFLKIQNKFPDEIYGYEMAWNNSRIIDSTKKDSIAVPDALKLFDFSQKDTVKYKKQYLNSAGFLATYYANDAKDATKALEYINKMLTVDPTNANLNDVKTQLENSLKKQPPNQKNTSGGAASSRTVTNGNK
ncbi:MAG: tetratricopeptide repeat protein [Bacteroidetes bacterium]|nr:tetratricopeptide repeat protein [Bacteroidota bacterium]MBS1931265.1 tetratricopeptide repeat protein [Bacteroidota bacterium]